MVKSLKKKYSRKSSRKAYKSRAKRISKKSLKKSYKNRVKRVSKKSLKGGEEKTIKDKSLELKILLDGMLNKEDAYYKKKNSFFSRSAIKDAGLLINNLIEDKAGIIELISIFIKDDNAEKYQKLLIDRDLAKKEEVNEMVNSLKNIDSKL